MSEVNSTRCEFVEEVENAAREARKKAAANWKGPLVAAYAQVSLEMRGIVHRHIAKCIICQQEELQSNRGASLSSLEVIQ
jgi:hypothetical protein